MWICLMVFYYIDSYGNSRANVQGQKNHSTQDSRVVPHRGTN